MNLFSPLFALDRLLARIEGALLVASVLFLLAFAFVQVCLRNFFDSGINWADVFNRSMVLWISFFGATLAASEDRHFSLEITKLLPARVKVAANILVCAGVICVCVALTHYSWLFFLDQREFEAEDLLFTGFPKYYFTIVFPVGFALLTFRYFVKLVENAVAMVTGKNPNPHRVVAEGGH